MYLKSLTAADFILCAPGFAINIPIAAVSDPDTRAPPAGQIIHRIGDCRVIGPLAAARRFTNGKNITEN